MLACSGLFPRSPEPTLPVRITHLVSCREKALECLVADEHRRGASTLRDHDWLLGFLHLLAVLLSFALKVGDRNDLFHIENYRSEPKGCPVAEPLSPIAGWFGSKPSEPVKVRGISGHASSPAVAS